MIPGPLQGAPVPEGEESARLFAAIVERLQNGESAESIRHEVASTLTPDEVAAVLDLAREVAVPLVRRVPEVAGYRLLRPLGQGSSGVVWLASQVSLGREVALKVIDFGTVRAPHLRERCLREARTLARIHDPRVVAVHDVVEHGDCIAIVMDHVSGPSLRTLLRAVRARPEDPPPSAAAHFMGIDRARFGPSWPSWVVRQGIRIARALACLHEQGLVHRDVKPENLLLQSDGEIVLADLGLTSDEAPGSFSGTLLYAAPEQAANASTVDGRADIYSLALVLYELLARSLPLADRLPRDGAGPSLAVPLPPLRRRAPEASRDLAVVLHHALEPDPERRYPTAHAFADDLERVSHLMPILAAPPGPFGRALRFLQRHRRAALAVGVAIAVTCAGFVLVLRALQDRIDAPVAAAEHVQAARNWLLASFDGEREERLRQAVGEYDQALLRVSDPAIKLERNISELAAELLEAQRGEFSRLLAAELAAPTASVGISLGLEVRAAALQWLRNQTIAQPLAANAPSSSQQDARSIGLLACLLGDLRGCEAVWNRLDPGVADLPLVDAGLGLLFDADGRPQLALPCLLRASAAFPAGGRLAIVLADTALELGDIGLARRSLERARAGEGAPAAVMQRIEADLCAASGDLASARAAYERLLTGVAADPVVLQRLAALDARDAHHRQCVQRLREVVALAPDRADYRLALARAALQAGDLICYLQQAREAVRRLRAVPAPPRGAIRSWLGLLQAGGCVRLAQHFSERLGQYEVLHPSADVLAAKSRTRSTEWVEKLVERFCLADAHEWTIPQTQDRLVLEPMSWLVRTVIAAPDLAICVHPVLGLAAVAASLAADRHRNWIVQEAVPAAWLAVASSFGPSASAGDPLRVDAAAGSCSSLVRWQQEGGERLALAACVTDATRPRSISAITRLGNSLAGSVRVVSWSGSAAPSVLHATEPAAVVGCRLAVLDDGTTHAAVALAVGAVGRGQGGIRVVAASTGAVRWERWKEDRQSSMPWAVEVIGDVDGDGLQDLAVGSPSPEHPLRPIETVRVLSGSDGHRLASFGGPAHRFCGIAVAAFGDTDRDGLPDLAVGCPHRQSGPGSVVVISPRDGQVVRELQAPHGEPGFGRVLISMPDLDGDGQRDLAVSDGVAPTGRVRLRPQVWTYGSRSGALLWSRAADQPDPSFGTALAATTDLDADGCVDLLIGAPNSGIGRCGLVLACSGRDGRLLRVIAGQQLRESLGSGLLGNATQPSRPALALGNSETGGLQVVPLDLGLAKAKQTR